MSTLGPGQPLQVPEFASFGARDAIQQAFEGPLSGYLQQNPAAAPMDPDEGP